MKLTVVFIDSWRVRVAMEHEGRTVPPGRRCVQIDLTPEQIEKLATRKVGSDGGKPVHDEIEACWIEPEAQP